MENEIGLKRISPSMLQEYQACPLLFYYRSWLGLKLEDVQVHFAFGTAIHLAIDALYEGRNEDGSWTLRIAGDNAVEIFKKNFVYSPQLGVDMVKYEEMLADGVVIVQEYWDNKEILLANGVDPVAFEIPGKDFVCNPETKEPLPIPLSYRLDCIGKNHTVVEFKTSSAPYDNFETRARPQSLCYIWAYYHKYGVIPVLHYVVMLKKRKKDKIQHLWFRYEMADILAFDAEVRATLDKIKNREFSKPLKGHNKWCDCRKFEEALKY
jgi:hypothetical protein